MHPPCSNERHLILIKHSVPIVTPGVPPAHWPLSATGHARLGPLAARLAAYTPAALAASDELKARETAEGLAAELLLPTPTIDHDLREQERDPSDFFPKQADFQAAIRDLFARPDEHIFGRETATAALNRFDTAVGRHLATTSTGNLLIVAHGTVISLFAAAHSGIAPFPLWQLLGLPSYVVLTLPDFHLITIVPGMKE